MRKLLSIGMTFAVVAMTALAGSRTSAQERNDAASVRDRFVGAWRLVWLEEEGADGTLHKADCSGMLVFTREGRMSVQVQYADPQAGNAGGPVQYAQGGYEASFGRFQVDADARSFSYHVEGALVRALVGKDLKRGFELSGSQLIVKSANPSERWRVAWEHY